MKFCLISRVFTAEFRWFKSNHCYQDKYKGSDEEETRLILNGVKYELTEAIVKKLQRLDLLEDSDLLPRNLSILIMQHLS
jgi:hypothetical protein